MKRYIYLLAKRKICGVFTSAEIDPFDRETITDYRKVGSVFAGLKLKRAAMHKMAVDSTVNNEKISNPSDRAGLIEWLNILYDHVDQLCMNQYIFKKM
jgi:hypothetical protein